MSTNIVALGFVPCRSANIYGNAVESALSLAPNSIAHLPSDAVPTNGAEAMLLNCWANTPFTVNAATGTINTYLLWVGPGKGDATGICPPSKQVDYRVQLLNKTTFTFTSSCLANGTTGINVPDSNRLAVSFAYGTSGNQGCYIAAAASRTGSVPTNLNGAILGGSTGASAMAVFPSLLGATHLVFRFTNFTSVDGSPSTDNYGGEYMLLRHSPIA